MTENNNIAHRPVWWHIATWFGCGLSPIASGTAGSLGALPFAYVIQKGFSVYFGNVVCGNIALFIASILMFFVGWWASNQYLKHTGRDDDPKEIVVDEVAGQWLLLSVLFPTWHSYLVGSVLFRAFNIIKPWPVSWADAKIKGGIGVMFDDMLAALYPILVFLFILIEAQLLGSQKLLLPVMNFPAEVMFTNDLRDEAAEILDICRSKGLKLATAESCTGGLISALLTEIPGSSDVFERGFITYSNRSKTEMLGVDAALIEENGAVSDPVAAAMVQGALDRARADLAIAVTGITGPDGGTEQKPVGLVYIGVATRKNLMVVKNNFSGDRSKIRLQSVAKALEILKDNLSHSFVYVA